MVFINSYRNFRRATTQIDIWPESLQRTTLVDLKISQLAHVDLPLQAGELLVATPFYYVDYSEIIDIIKLMMPIN